MNTIDTIADERDNLKAKLRQANAKLRKAKRELAAAKERIRRLEAAGNAMHHEMQFGEWRAGTPRAQANAARHSWLAEMGGRV
jgi:phage shock protein A